MEIECTQRLECTQDQHDPQFERTNPEQVGYLGICGKKYPVSKGPNKIGRDKRSCSIALQLDTISRHHAVINVLNMKEFMLMDLDSVNKTKVQGNTLQPYIPHPLKNFDMVQFGDVFGVFRLLEDSDDLPMTQAVDIPCTPVQVSKQRCGAPSVLITESPEVSDKDDSFIMPSQPIQTFKSPVNKFLKPSNKTIAIQPVGSKKIDNAYWQSRKKSDSFYLDDSGSSLNDSTASLKSNKVINESNDNIHEMETQEPYKMNESTDSIYTAETQPPPSPSIHFMETQQPVSDIHGLDTQQPDDIHNLNTQNIVETIHNCETQAPTDEMSPELQKITNHDDVKSDVPRDIKYVDSSIFNAESQIFLSKEDVDSNKEDNQVESIKGDPIVETKNNDDLIEPNKPADLNRNSLEKLEDKNDSDEEILFDEINTQSIEESFESQQLLPAEVSPRIDKVEPIRVTSKSVKLASSTNCDDFEILPTQKLTIDFEMLPTQKIMNDIDMLPTQKINNDDEDLTDCEDDFVDDEFTKPKSPEINFEDMATQILRDDEIAAELPQSKDQIDGACEEIKFEDMPTQVISDDSKNENFEDMPTQVIIEDINDSGRAPIKDNVDSPFKVPISTPMKNKKVSSLASRMTPKSKETVKENVDEPNYYAATQDIFNDLCSQKEQIPNDNKPGSINNEPDNDDDIVPCSVEEYQTDDRFPHLENDLTPVNMSPTPNNDVNEATDQKTRANGKHKDSVEKTNIDVDNRTPKPLKIMNTDLPDSQEIKTSVTLHHNSITESSSDTELEEISDQDSKITFGKKKKKSKINAKIDLTKKFEESLPSRIITRVRKPTYKLLNSDESAKNQSRSILKNSVLDDGVENIDSEIINENISRLKSKCEKRREKDDNTKSHTDESKKRSSSRNETKRSEESKEESNSVSMSRSSRSKTKKSAETKSNHKSHKDSDSEKEVKSTRSSKSKKEKDSKNDKSKHDNDKKTKSKDKERSDSKSKSRTRNEKKESKNRDVSNPKDSDKGRHMKTESSPEMEIRRSERQKDRQSKETSNEISTVYCLSSDSSLDSPKTLKRRACNELEVPSPKRTRSLPNSKTSSVSTSTNVSVRSTPVRSQVHYVLFTAFSNDDVRIKLENLGAVLVTDVMECTVLVTLQIKRTFKLLCAVGLGRPIVGPAWVQACADKNTIVDPWQYIVKDEPAEKRFRFSLEKTLRGQRGFLRGFNVSSTPSVLPNAQEMKLIVECSGGSWREGGPNWVVVSCSADRALWPALRRRGATVVSTEFILGGVLRQEADTASAAFGPEQPKKKAAGEFICGVCGRRCLSRIGLSSHARSHTKS